MSERMQQLKSASEIALRLGISKPTLCRLMQKQVIGFYRIGTRVLFDEEKHIQPYLLSCERKAQTGEKGRGAA